MLTALPYHVMSAKFNVLVCVINKLVCNEQQPAKHG